MTEIVVERFSEITPKPIRWLWKSYLPRGKLCLLDGDPGVGKSLITMDLAARLSRGDTLPDGQKLDRRHVTAFLAAEDDAADTMRPRAEAAGANLEFIVSVTGKPGSLLQVPNDLYQISRYVGHHQADLLIIDPIVAFLPPSVSVTSDQCVRQALCQLAQFAQGCDCTVLMIRHLRKAGTANVLYRGSGSIGFIASARTGLSVSRNPTDPNSGILSVVKSNLVERPTPLGYRIATSPSGLAVLEWTGPAAVNEPISAPDLRPRDRASVWLQEQMENGPRRASELYLAAAAAGISERTLRRAMRELDLRCEKQEIQGGKREWVWSEIPSTIELSDRTIS